MLELSRWGMSLQKLEDVTGLAPSSLPNAIRVILRLPPTFGSRLACAARAVLRAAHRRRLDRRLTRRDRELRPQPGGYADRRDRGAGRAEAEDVAVEVEGDRELLDELRSMVVIPEHLREEALAAVNSGGRYAARTA